ncbi:MAG TPA: hypothetical protein VMU52_03910 [Steroidobacteraceae bacterium]|nr:hypothetical protein [Steroidobacteraceae bacterium]
MATSDSTATPDPSPRPQAGGGSPAFAVAVPSPLHVLYWSVRRELWENRFLYFVPLIVAALILSGFALGGIHPQFAHTTGSPPRTEQMTVTPLDQASLSLMLCYVIIGVIYCLGALYNERSDRSILFWKSLPVSDVTSVIAKACIPVVILPLIIFAVIVITQGIMVLAASAALFGRHVSGSALWAGTPLLPMWAATLYHLLAVHGLYYAPIYGWLLLASAWARRAPILWASLPVAAVLIIERLVFHTSAFAHLLLSRLGGGPAAIKFPPPVDMPMRPGFADLGAFLASPGLWIGLVIFALFLAAAVRVRRYQGPI